MRNPRRFETQSTVAILLALAAVSAAAGAVAAQQPAADPSAPETLTTAFERARLRMAQDKAPGLVFVLPAAAAAFDAKAAAQLTREFAGSRMWGTSPVELKTARDVMLARVQRLRASRTPAAAALRLTVPIVAEPSMCGSRRGETIVLLSADGRRLAGFDVDLGDEAAVLEALTPDVLAKKAVEPRRANVEPALASCPPCGMMAVPLAQRSTLKLLTQ